MQARGLRWEVIFAQPLATASGSVPISTADFAIPDRRLAIYVDGEAFHVGANTRRDRYIRDRLKNGTLA